MGYQNIHISPTHALPPTKPNANGIIRKHHNPTIKWFKSKMIAFLFNLQPHPKQSINHPIVSTVTAITPINPQNHQIPVNIDQ